MTYAKDLEVVVNALVRDKLQGLRDPLRGRSVGGGTGVGAGSVTLDGEDVFDGDGAFNSDLEEKQRFRRPFEVGDEPEQLQAFDCETGEKVTLDGLNQQKGADVPVEFKDCKAPKAPTLADLQNTAIYVAEFYSNYYVDPPIFKRVYSLDLTAYYAMKSEAVAFAEAESGSNCSPYISTNETEATGNTTARPFIWYIPSSGVGYCGGDTKDRIAFYRRSTSTADKLAYIEAWEPPQWSAVDKNHLVYNQEKGCMEPLCPDVNNQVLGKFQGCNDVLILCDEKGNKIHVKMEGGEIQVTSATNKQTAVIKDGKVQRVYVRDAEEVAKIIRS